MDAYEEYKTDQFIKQEQDKAEYERTFSNERENAIMANYAKSAAYPLQAPKPEKERPSNEEIKQRHGAFINKMVAAGYSKEDARLEADFRVLFLSL